MKRLAVIPAAVVLCASVAAAQAPQQVVQCRPLKAGDFLGPNDSIVGTGGNTQVCSVVLVKAANQAASPAPMPVNASDPKSADVAQPAAPQAVAAVPQAPETGDTQPAKIEDGKIRIYVTDRPITEVISMMKAGSQSSGHAYGSGNGSVSGNSSGFRGNYSSNYSASVQQTSYAAAVTNDNRAGADPRTLEVSSDLLKDCHVSNLVVTSNPANADYILDFRREGGKRSTFFVFGGLTGLALSSAAKVDHAAVYAPNGDLVHVANARTVGGAVKDSCSYLK